MIFPGGMEDDLKERLENQAFMTNFVRTPGEGIGVAEWVDFVSASVGGFIGDVQMGRHAEPWRIVIAMSHPPFDPRPEASDIHPAVVAAFNRRLAEIGDREQAEALSGLARLLRSRFSTGGTVECSLAAAGASLDFSRGRHLVNRGRELLAIHVHGRLLLGRATDPASPVAALLPDGNCVTADGMRVPFSVLSAPSQSWSDDVAIEVPARTQAARGTLAERIARSTAGSPAGPAPSALIVSRGEDGRVMLALKGDPGINGKFAVRLLPSAIQVAADGKVIAQSAYDDVAGIAEWLDGAGMEICLLGDDRAVLRRSAVEIRTSA